MSIRYAQPETLLICNTCEDIIDAVPSSRASVEEWEMYEDLNNGHECVRCRKRRERLYDAYVTNPGR